jgi:hypothetical protein
MMTERLVRLYELTAAGTAALAAGETVAARRALREALEIDPAHVPALLALAASVRMLRERRDLYLRAVTAAPHDPAARDGLAATDALLAQGLLLDPAVRNDAAAAPEAEPTAAPAVTLRPAVNEYCYRHPGRETGLHCIGCSKPICTQCAERTPVGMICPQCARERLPITYQAGVKHIVLAGLTAFLLGIGLSLAALLISAAAGFFAFFVAFLLGSVAGNLTSRAVLWAAERKRGRTIMITVGAAYVLGAVPALLVYFSLPLVLFTVLAVIAAVSNLR